MDIADSRNTLIDQNGPWCAVCLRYSRRREPLFPIISRAATLVLPSSASQSLARYASMFPLSGDIPVHKICLETTPALSVMPKIIMTYTLALGRRNVQEIDNAAKNLHDHGIYPVSAALNQLIIERLKVSASPDDNSTVLERRLASEAGVRRRSHHPLSSVNPSMSPRAILHLSNAEANAGHLKKAEQLLRHAEQLRNRMSRSYREASEAHYRMRVAQVRRTPFTARDAIEFAKTDSYMMNTAYVLAGHIFIPHDLIRARTYFEAIIAQGSGASWLYRAESLLGLAALMLFTSRNAAEAYKLLSAAQYIYVLLNLQGTPHPNIHSHLRRVDLTPSDVLFHDPSFEKLSSHRRTALRKEAIIDTGLQKELLGDLLFMFPISHTAGHNSIELAAAKFTSVLILGQDTSKIQVLKDIRTYLQTDGYRGILVKDEVDIPQETNEEKVLRLAAGCRFVIVEQSTAAGQIDELQLLAPNRYAIAILHRERIQATWMQSDYDITFRGVSYFAYRPATLAKVIGSACRWAEDHLAKKEQDLAARYPWR